MHSKQGFTQEFLVEGGKGDACVSVWEIFARPCPFSGVSFYMYLIVLWSRGFTTFVMYFVIAIKIFNPRFLTKSQHGARPTLNLASLQNFPSPHSTASKDCFLLVADMTAANHHEDKTVIGIHAKKFGNWPQFTSYPHTQNAIHGIG